MKKKANGNNYSDNAKVNWNSQTGCELKKRYGKKRVATRI